MIFSETFGDVSFTKALEKWLILTNEQEGPLDGTQKNWAQPVYVKTAQEFISRMDAKRSKIFNADQGKRDRKSELVLRSTNQIFEWDRNKSDRNFYNVVRYVHIPLVP